MTGSDSSCAQEGTDKAPAVEFTQAAYRLIRRVVVRAGLSEVSQRCHVQLGVATDTISTPYFESATAVDPLRQALEREVDAILRLALDEHIEDGMESETALEINHFVARNSAAGVQQLAASVTAAHTNAGVAADIVRMLGRIVHKGSHRERLWVAERLLRSKSALVRDASAVALEELGDPRAIVALQEAAAEESIPELRSDIELALRELTRNADVSHSPEA